jgi:hypothetical protein
MTTMGTGPANPPGRPRGSRNRAILNEEFIAALLRHFRRHGEGAIARMAATQPAAYCKLLTLLVPRDHKIEYSNVASSLTDEQLALMVAELEDRIARRLADSDAKLIEGTVEATAVETTALPVLEPPKRRPNRLMMEADTAIGPRERRPRKRKVPSPTAA